MRGYILFIGIICLFSGCAYQYNPKKLTIDQKVEFSYQVKLDNVNVRFNTISSFDNQGYFKKYVPVRFLISNNSSKSYVLNSKSIDLELASFDELKKKIPRVIFSYFIPSSISMLAGIFFWLEACLPLAVVSGITAFFFGNNHKKRNTKRLQRLFFGSNQEIKIDPFSEVEKIVFIKKDNYHPSFKFILFNYEEHLDLNFDVLIVAKNSSRYGLG